MTIYSENDLLRSAGFINGAWIEANEKFEVVNPATQETITRVSDLNTDHTKKAIDAAQNALENWKSMTAQDRANILHKWCDLIEEHIEPLQQILTREMGKPLAEAKGEILYGAKFIRWFAEEAKRAYGDIIPPFKKGTRILVTKEAVGVVAAITPWNFPSAMITRKVAPALAAGCTIILKPSEETPLSALALGVLAEKAGFPNGVINIIPTTDSKNVGKELCRNPAIKKLSFTGSTPVGKILMEQCASTLKKLSLELGGNAPFIVFPSADIDKAVEGLIACKFRNAGQTCVSANRIYIHNDIYKTFSEKLKTAIQKMKIGNGTQDNVDIGPLINKSAVEKVKNHIQSVLDTGGLCIQGGKTSDAGMLFFEPTILTDVTDQAAMSCDETFGPVAALFKFNSEDDVVKRANSVNHGLASYFYSSDLAQCFRVSEALEYGMVGINEPILSSEAAPFGGIKESGFGREGSKYGLDDYLNIKYSLLGGL